MFRAVVPIPRGQHLRSRVCASPPQQPASGPPGSIQIPPTAATLSANDPRTGIVVHLHPPMHDSNHPSPYSHGPLISLSRCYILTCGSLPLKLIPPCGGRYSTSAKRLIHVSGLFDPPFEFFLFHPPVCLVCFSSHSLRRLRQRPLAFAGPFAPACSLKVYRAPDRPVQLRGQRRPQPR